MDLSSPMQSSWTGTGRVRSWVCRLPSTSSRHGALGQGRGWQLLKVEQPWWTWWQVPVVISWLIRSNWLVANSMMSLIAAEMHVRTTSSVIVDLQVPLSLNSKLALNFLKKSTSGPIDSCGGLEGMGMNDLHDMVLLINPSSSCGEGATVGALPKSTNYHWHMHVWNVTIGASPNVRPTPPRKLMLSCGTPQIMHRHDIRLD